MQQALLEKLTVLQEVEEFFAFYGTQRLNKVFTTARQLSLFWTTTVQFLPILFPEDPL
jgi:hypothetical protein